METSYGYQGNCFINYICPKLGTPFENRLFSVGSWHLAAASRPMFWQSDNATFSYLHCISTARGLIDLIMGAPFLILTASTNLWLPILIATPLAGSGSDYLTPPTCSLRASFQFSTRKYPYSLQKLGGVPGTCVQNPLA